MKLTIYTARCTGRKSNCSYPDRREITDADELREAVRFNHVCGEYKGNRRSIENFRRSNVLVMDCDNDHSENSDDWITFEKVEELFGDYSYALATSRNHMKVKDGKAARPKFHIYFEIGELTDPEAYAALKRGIQKICPFFDDNALDAARFLFGSTDSEIVWHEGWTTIDEDTDPVYEEEEAESNADGGDFAVIHQGSRNNTMSRFAGRILKRYGVTEKAQQAFMEHAAKCDPPLPEDELKTIWASAVKFFNKKISSSDGYVPPDQYNADFGDSLKPEDYSDIGEAKVLVREYGQELKFSPATDYLRYDGDRWVEDVQLAIGAIEEFLDLQLVDAMQDKEAAEKALVKAGIAEATVKAGSKAVQKDAETPEQIKALIALLAAETYLKFVMRRRDYKYIISTGNAAKPMIAVDVNDLDKDQFLLNTPDGTYNLKQGLSGQGAHDYCLRRRCQWQVYLLEYDFPGDG